MPKVKVSEATGPVLDWMVAKCAGMNCVIDEGHVLTGDWYTDSDGNYLREEFNPSESWSQGGPLIEREKIGIGHAREGEEWLAAAHDPSAPLHAGATPLIAAMRCYVASKLGDEVEVPEELMP